jgi:hypothetical protein
MSHFPRNPWGGARLPESTEPAGADPLAEMLETLRRPGLADELAGEARSVAQITAAVRAAGTTAHDRRTPVASRRFRLALTAALVGAGLTAMSGLAYAGALPGAAQGVASDVLAHVGVSAPAPHDGSAADEGPGAPAADDPAGDTGVSADSSGTPGEDTGDPGGADEGSQPPDSNEHGKGKTISELAHSTPGPGKGKIVSAAASGGKSHAGNPPGQTKKGGDEAGSHKPDHPDHPDHPTGGGNGHKHGGSGDHGNGS